MEMKYVKNSNNNLHDLVNVSSLMCVIRKLCVTI